MVVVTRGITLDDSVFSLVDKVLDPQDGSFYIYCFRCKSEACECTEAVRQFRKDAHVDTDKKD
jgi:hypothetical protein